MRKFLILAALVAAFSVVLVACGDDDDDGGSSEEVVRSVLATTLPDESPEHELMLSRVTVPAGAQLASHTHPGPQLAWIFQGTLTYTVESGEMSVVRDASTEDEERITVGAGETVDLEPGDSVIERPGAVHSARNDGDDEVIIFLSSLFDEGAPASSPAN